MSYPLWVLAAMNFLQDKVYNKSTSETNMEKNDCENLLETTGECELQGELVLFSPWHVFFLSFENAIWLLANIWC